MIETLTSVGLKPPAELARLVELRAVLGAQVPDRSSASGWGVHRRHFLSTVAGLDPKAAAATLSETAIKIVTHDVAARLVNEAEREIDLAIDKIIAAHFDNFVDELRPRFDEAAGELVEITEHLGPGDPDPATTLEAGSAAVEAWARRDQVLAQLDPVVRFLRAMPGSSKVYLPASVILGPITVAEYELAEQVWSQPGHPLQNVLAAGLALHLNHQRETLEIFRVLEAERAEQAIEEEAEQGPPVLVPGVVRRALNQEPAAQERRR